jgi:uncharacterized protein (TIGR03067 family)
MHRESLVWAGLCCFIVAVAHAEVLELEGTIKSVDAAKREITIGRKTLDVAKKCQITIDGADATLADLKADQEVVVEFDDELEVAKSISVGEAPDPQDETTRVLKALQGEWEAVEAEFNGQPLERNAVRRLNRLVTINGNSFKEEMIRDGRVVGVEGKFGINPKTKAFDFSGRITGTKNAHEYLGIFELDGDTLRLCCRANEDGTAKRPTQFKSDSQKPNWSHYYVYKRLEK